MADEGREGGRERGEEGERGREGEREGEGTAKVCFMASARWW
jgi:hypothetical protein